MRRREGGQAIDVSRVAVGPAVDDACPQGDDERPHRRHAPLEAARRAHADQRSPEQAHVEGARVDEQSFEDVGVPAQMRPPHAPGGRGVPQDYVTAHMWANLAGARGDEEARELRDRLAEEMSAGKIAAAQRAAREWRPARR